MATDFLEREPDFSPLSTVQRVEEVDLLRGWAADARRRR